MAKVKICGLFRPEDIPAVNQAQPDYIGFVFANSKRQITPEHALTLSQQLHPDILPVGVFSNHPLEYIMQVVDTGAISLIQLHGQEGSDYIFRLKQMTDLPIIKSVAVQALGDAQRAELLPVDYLLLDYKAAGSGQSFNWEHIGTLSKPFFLAGGINMDNIDQALRYHPYAIDTSSGVETNGYKDLYKIIQITRRIRDEQR